MTTMPAPTGEQYTLTLERQQAVVTAVGATLRSYRADGAEVIAGFPEHLAPFGCQGQQLAPWPNRIRDGRWTHRGRQQQLPITEPARHNAIHGLVMARRFTVVAQDERSITQRLLLEPEPGWPGSVELLITHALSEAGLQTRMQATNLGDESIPFGYAAHPYLMPPQGLVIDECSLTLPFARHLVADERLLPVAVEEVAGTRLDLRSGQPIGGLELDDAFTSPELRDGEAEAWQVRLASGAMVHLLWADASMRWVQVYTPGDRASIAVEPMTIGPDAFNPGPTHDDLVELAPGETTSCLWGIRREAADA